jgi:hypothetical protein
MAKRGQKATLVKSAMALGDAHTGAIYQKRAISFI